MDLPQFNLLFHGDAMLRRGAESLVDRHPSVEHVGSTPFFQEVSWLRIFLARVILAIRAPLPHGAAKSEHFFGDVLLVNVLISET